MDLSIELDTLRVPETLEGGRLETFARPMSEVERMVVLGGS